MATHSLAHPAHPAKLPYKGRKARTNRGRFMHLEARYRRGDLLPAEEEAFEAACLAIHRLYKAAY